MTDEELKGLFEVMRKENADRFDGVQKQFASMREENAAAHVETRRHFDTSLERLERRVDFLAETVQLVNDNQRSTAAALDEKIERTTKETHGLIRFVNDGLHRRVLVLE